MHRKINHWKAKKTYFYRNPKVLNSRLQLQFDHLEKERYRLLEQVAQLTPEQLHQTVPDKWSIGQILAHLVSAERLSIRYINKKILGIQEAGTTGVWEEIKMVLLILSQRLPFKFKAPKVVVLNTPTYATVQELKADWDREREELKELLEKFEDYQLEKKIYRHVRVGILNIQQALIFFREHYFHHLPQIKRLL